MADVRRGGATEAGENTYLCDIITQYSGGATALLPPGGGSHRRDFSFEIRGLERTPAFFIQIRQIFAPQYHEKYHIEALDNLRFCSVVSRAELRVPLRSGGSNEGRT